jgi:hypothetical protein
MASRKSPKVSTPLRSRGLTALLCGLLAACGGFSDFSNDDSVVAETTSTSAASSGATTVALGVDALGQPTVPAASEPGAVLYASATSLRPLADEALWVYRGTRTANGQQLHYSSFRQVTASAAGFQERVSSPLPNASRIQTLTPGTEQIGIEQDLILAVGTFIVRGIELKSPVRQGEQVKLAQVQSAPLALDLDGDGKQDLIDVAAWSQVVGNEDVELPELERTVRALRVDTTLVSRTHRSSQAQPDTSQTVVQSTWYAPGVGIVRNSRTQPVASSAGVGAVESDERLQVWDGITTGLGLLPSSPVSVTGGSAAVGPWLGQPFSAVRQGNQAFVLSAASAGNDALTLSVLSGRGRLEHSVEHSGLATLNQPRPQLMPLAAGVAVVRREAGVLLFPDQLENLKLTRFDAKAQRVGKDIWLVDSALAGSLQAASDGQTIWVSWVDPGSPQQPRRLMLQGFDALGDIKTRAHSLDTRGGTETMTQIAVTAQQGRVMVNWRVESAAGVELRQALGSATSPPTVATLTTTSATTSITTLATASSALAGAAVTPLLTESLAAITWLQPLDSSNRLVAPRAVALDGAAQARRATSGGLDQELLALPAGSVQAAARMTMAAETKRVLWAAAGTGRLRSDTEAEDRTLAFATVDAGDAALSAALPQLKRLRDSSPASAWQGSVQALQHIVPLDDRWLIIGHDGRYTTVAVLHKR